jgi:hypothetical protein
MCVATNTYCRFLAYCEIAYSPGERLGMFSSTKSLHQNLMGDQDSCVLSGLRFQK